MPLNLSTLQAALRALKVLVDFMIVWVLVYYTLKVVRNNSRTVQIFKGVVLIILVRFIAYYLDLTVVLALADFAIQYGPLLFVVIFQQEIRAILERLGKSTVFSSLHSLSDNERERLINELVNAAETLSERNIGALVALEQGHSLVDYIKTGTPINSSFTADLLVSIFVTTTPLHDGAVILQGDRIACASAYFPPTAMDLPTRYGARHRAAIGLSEITDSITLVVSEETGTISIAEAGKLTEMDVNSLRDYLTIMLQDSEKEVSNRVDFKVTRRVNFSKFNVDPIKIEKIDEDEVKETKQSLFTKGDKEEEKPVVKKRDKLFRKMKDEPTSEADIESLKSATTRSDQHEDDGGENDGSI